MDAGQNAGPFIILVAAGAAISWIEAMSPGRDINIRSTRSLEMKAT